MRYVFPALLIVVPLLPLLPAAPVPKDPPAPQYFPTAVGTRWVYLDPTVRPNREFTEEVTSAERDGDVTVVSISREMGRTWVVRGRFAVSPRGFHPVYRVHVKTPPFWGLRLPARAGDRWTYDYPPGMAFQKATLTVRGEEAVTVPAGEYKALRVETRFGGEGGAQVGRQLVHWYAPDVGLVKADAIPSDPKTAWLLKSFTPGTGVTAITPEVPAP